MTAAFDAQSEAAHEEWETLAVGYAVSALEPGEVAAFEAHLTDCARCRRSVAESESVAGLLGSVPVAVEPSPELRMRVLGAAFDARPPSVTPAPSAEPRPVPAAAPMEMPSVIGPRHRRGADAPVVSIDVARRRRGGLRRGAPWLVSAVAAVVAAVLAVSVIGANHDRNHAQNVADARASIINSITGSGPAEIVPLKNDGGSQIATVVAHEGTVSVVSSGMPVNSRTSTYVLWGLTSATDANPKAIGTFDVTKDGITATQVANDLRGSFSSLHTFAVSHESGRSAPAHPSKILGIGTA